MFLIYITERRGGRIGEKSVVLILRKNRPVQHTFKSNKNYQAARIEIHNKIDLLKGDSPKK
jgi:hypothetical protein